MSMSSKFSHHDALRNETNESGMRQIERNWTGSLRRRENSDAARAGLRYFGAREERAAQPVPFRPIGEPPIEHRLFLNSWSRRYRDPENLREEGSRKSVRLAVAAFSRSLTSLFRSSEPEEHDGTRNVAGDA